jgi:hypothetical protein
MNKRNLMITAAWLLCLGTVSAVFVQRSQLAGLRARQAQSLSVNSDAAQSPSSPDTAVPPDSAAVEDSSREVLRLRAQVTRLTARKRELAGVVEERERLKAQLATNSPAAGGLLVPGYVRRAQAVFLGYSTPENTMQSWLWAIQNQDSTKMLQALSPDGVQNLPTRLDSGRPEIVFKDLGVTPGLAIQSRQNLPDGSVELEVYIEPNLPAQKVRLHQQPNGEWKMDSFLQ